MSRTVTVLDKCVVNEDNSVYNMTEDELFGSFEDYIESVNKGNLDGKYFDIGDVDTSVFIIDDGGELFRLKDGTYINVCWRGGQCRVWPEDDSDVITYYNEKLGKSVAENLTYSIKEALKELQESVDQNVISLDDLRNIAIGTTVNYDNKEWKIDNVNLFRDSYVFNITPISGEQVEGSYMIAPKTIALGGATVDNGDLLNICIEISNQNQKEKEEKDRLAAELAARKNQEREQNRLANLERIKQQKIDAAKQAGEADGRTKKRVLYSYFKDLLNGGNLKLRTAKLQMAAAKYDPQTYVDAYEEARLKWRYQNQTTNSYGSNEDAVNWLANHWVKIYAMGPEEMLNQFQDEFDIHDDNYIKVREQGLALGIVMQCDIPYDDPSDPAPGFLTNMYHTDVLGNEFNNGFSERRKNLFKTTSYIVYLLRTYPGLFWVGKKNK